jgi:HEAT repeat protein
VLTTWKFPQIHGHYGALVMLLTIATSAAHAQTTAGRDAAAAKIASSLADRNIEQALVAYDAYVDSAKIPDISLLRPIARAELERAAQASDGEIAAGALERLSRGDAETMSSLRRVAESTTQGGGEPLAATISLARLGDKTALSRLASRLDTASPEMKVNAIQVLQRANAKAHGPAVAALLDDPAPTVRAAAAVAVGALQYKEAIPKLQALYGSDLPTVKMLAGVALTRLGETTAETAVATLLKSEVPEMRLMAGQALQTSRSAEWMPLVKELRNDPNPAHRVRAAEIVACCDPTWSKGILLEALANSMALVRMDAARVLEEYDLADARSARRMLGDSTEPIRMYGAGAVLRLSAKSAR